MKRGVIALLLALLLAAITFFATIAWAMAHVEVYWNHDSVSLYILGHEWVHGAYCDCSDCQGGILD